MRIRFLFCLFTLLLDLPGRAAAADAPPPDPRALMNQQAAKLHGSSDPTRDFLKAVPELPIITPRTVWYDKANRKALTEEEAAARSEAERTGFEKRTFDETFYYFTRYGTPLAFVRPLDLVATAGMTSLAGKRILDFGFGSIGHLRLMACLGADVVGVEVDDLLRALYSAPDDTGPVTKSAAADARNDGTLRLVFGSFPGDPDVAAAVGDGYDVIFSKNTLKKGYIHPDREADPRMLVHLGVDDSTFVSEVFRRLKPGGWFMIYNLHPALSRADEPYRPWSDGRCPFDRGLLEAAGFKVLAFDRDDTVFAREMGDRLGWGEQMTMETDLFGTYTLMQKPLHTD